MAPNLDPEWESAYDRVVYIFGNETRFIDKKFLHEGQPDLGVTQQNHDE